MKRRVALKVLQGVLDGRAVRGTTWTRAHRRLPRVFNAVSSALMLRAIRALTVFVLLASSALANDKPHIEPDAECCGCASCYCDCECLCPVYQQLPNGKRVVFTLEPEHPMWKDANRPEIGFAWFFNKPKRVWAR